EWTCPIMSSCSPKCLPTLPRSSNSGTTFQLALATSLTLCFPDTWTPLLLTCDFYSVTPLSIRMSFVLYRCCKYKEFERAVRVEEIDGLRLVKRLAENMEEMFHKKAQAMKRLVEAAEEAHLQHREDPNLQYEYFNAVLINEVDEEGNSVELGGEFILQPNDHFNNLSVNLSLSVVQVPTNMYNKDSAIVNGVYWSEALNKVFVDNFERDPSLIWQYFGSAKGFFRQYPGIKWKPDEHGVIAFDCRNRKWYIQAATSPKDVVILVDVSGSMKGLRLTIARQTVSSILDTLGDDDFFNIIAYNEELHYVEPCLNGTLVQADITNKDVSLSFLFNETGRGSECSQAIMLVTDGAVDTYDAIFAKYNWPERKVRIFPYLIGRESAFADNLKWMACANKGYFTQISTLADVQENVMEYLHVLSRPKVIDLEHDTVWTEAYIDSTRNRGILLGVVGTDVPVSELLKTIPKYKLGIHGYAFAITNNGYILTHPDLRPLYGDGKKRRKPNYSSVDLSEVEWEDKDDTLRNAMVNRKTGTFSMEVKKSVDKGVRNPKFKNAQTHTNKSFSDGPQRCARENTQLGESTLPRGLHDLEHPDVALADEWTYCNTDEHPEHRYLSQIEAIKLYLSGHEPHLKCDKELVQEVLFDAVVTAPLEAYWTSLVLNKSENSDKGVEIAYLGTRTGLSRINLFVVPDELTNQDFLTAEDKEGVFNADHFPLWYKRAAEQVPGTFVYSLPFNIGKFFGEAEGAVMSFQTASASECVLGCRIGRSMQVPCDTEYPAFVSERTIKENTGNIDCDGCIKSFVIQQIPSSNLFMVVVDNKCDCSIVYTLSGIALTSAAHNESLKCERLKMQKDRRRPDTCHPFHPEVFSPQTHILHTQTHIHTTHFYSTLSRSLVPYLFLSSLAQWYLPLRYIFERIDNA
uniref:VWFA domain-containing protein n=1 Tax=Amphiprion ocellaris TaxID=80972 RepID=A0AAQ5ZA38_AMPOC